MGLEGGPVLWEVAVDPDSGKATGRPRRTGKWLTADMCSITRSRDRKRMVFRRRTNRSDVYVGRLDSNNRLSTPRRLTLEDSDNRPYSWTPDSREVIFTSDRSGTLLTYKQALDQATAQPIVVENRNTYEPRVSPDGRLLLYLVDRPGGPGTRLMQVPLLGGPPHVLWDSKDEFDIQCPRVAAKTCLLTKASGDGRVTFALLNVMDGSVHDVFARTPRFVTGLSAALSPDGAEIAVMSSSPQKTGVEFLSISGQLKQRIEVKGWNSLSGLDYSADGKQLYTGFSGPAGVSLVRIGRSGRAESIWNRLGTNIPTWAIPSPDGKYLAFLANSSAENAWMLENP